MKKNANLFTVILLLLFAACGGGSKSTFSPDLFPVKSGDKWGYVDKEGKFIINAQFSEADYFSCGLALVATDKLYGFIDEEGNYIVSAQYLYALPFSEDMACVVAEGGSPKYINTKGEMVFELAAAAKAGSFHGGLAKFQDEKGKWGFVDKEGNIKITSQFDDALDFSSELAAVKVEGKDGAEDKWGYIDSEGSYVINPQFAKASSFSGELAAVSNGKQYGYINKKGEYVINPQFETVGVFLNDLAPVESSDKWGFIDNEGKFVINPQFDDVLCFSGNLAPVEQDNKWGFIDKDGKYLINAQFEYVSMFIGDVAIVKSADKYGFIDKDGKFTANPQFDRAEIGKTFFYTILGPGYNGKGDDVIESDKVPPLDEIVKSFYVSMDSKDYEGAKKLSTKASAESIDSYATFRKDSPDDQKSSEITEIDCKHKGSKAICKYLKNGEEECMPLRKVENEWLVEWSKGLGNCDEYNTMNLSDDEIKKMEEEKMKADSIKNAESYNNRQPKRK